MKVSGTRVLTTCSLLTAILWACSSTFRSLIPFSDRLSGLISRVIGRKLRGTLIVVWSYGIVMDLPIAFTTIFRCSKPRRRRVGMATAMSMIKSIKKRSRDSWAMITTMMKSRTKEKMRKKRKSDYLR